MFDYQADAAAAILESCIDAVFTIDSRGLIADLNSSAVRMFGWSRAELIGANIAKIIPAEVRGGHDRFLQGYQPERRIGHILGSGQRLDGERKDGSRFPVEIGITSFVTEGERYFTSFVRDVTERHLNEERMHYLATHDSATGLLNYRGFVGYALPDGDDDSHVLYFHLGEFRRLLNDCGYDFAELALQELALRLKGLLLKGERLGRVREDAFAVLSVQDAGCRAAHLQRQLHRPVARGVMHFPFTVTVGVSPARGSLSQRLADAQLACHQAGTQGQGRIHRFDEDMGQALARKRNLESRLRETLHGGGLSLVLQPKICLPDRKVVGAEALVRWHDAELGFVSPLEFIPLAEKLGLIGNITQWVLERSLQELARWPDRESSVAVNFSALDFLQESCIDTIQRAISAANVAPNRLVIELTESVLASNVELIKTRMRQIKDIGVTLSLDDFGTGYSSLSYLRQFPIDSLKIDASFVRDLPAQADAAAIACTIVALAKSLRLKTIAEGVEHEAQASFLSEREVDECQGYLFGKPMPPAEFIQLFQHAIAANSESQ